MVGFGMFMGVIATVGLFFWWRGKLQTTRWFLLALPFTIVLPYIANSTGWVLTELGRQPWIVQGLMRTEQGVSPNLTPADLWISLVGFTVVYGVLMAADFFLLWKFGRTSKGEDPAHPTPQTGDLQLENVY